MNEYFKRFIELKRLAQYDLPNENYTRNQYYLYIKYTIMIIAFINISIIWFNIGYILLISNSIAATFTWMALTALTFFYFLKKEYRIFALFGITSLITINVDTITQSQKLIIDWFHTITNSL